MGLFITRFLFYYHLYQKQGMSVWKIKNGEMILSECGKIVENEWMKSFK